MKDTVYLSAVGTTCALGARTEDIRSRLVDLHATALTSTERYSVGRPLPLGVVDDASLATALMRDVPLTQRSRTNALLATACLGIEIEVARQRDRFGPGRIAVVMGSSTIGVAETEAARRVRAREGRWPAHYDYAQQEMASASNFVASRFGLGGPAYALSTACSSGAKALASAARLIHADIADAVVCGGADALCDLTVAGFSSLEAVSERTCNPFSRNRDGINLGEGAAAFVLSRLPGPVRLAGWGETSDAYHVSAPDPTGKGAAEAMRLALDRARVEPEAIGYLNLHGTATAQNDAMESLAISGLFPRELPVSSTKPLTGHALAAAGALEAAFCWMLLTDTAAPLPPHWWDGETDPALAPLRFVRPGERADRPLRYAMSNSFAFGGSNAALVLGAA